MKTILRTLALTFSMYSRIPMPFIDYTENDMRYTFLCFPFVGVVLGLLEYGWYYLANMFLFNDIFYGAVATALPILVTGGFHMDGFIDTTDALSSHQPVERKLEILKDSHIGAFAAIWSGVYFVVYFAAFTELRNMSVSGVIVVCTAFVLSRITSGFAAINFPTAQGRHSLTSFSKAGDRSVVKGGLIIYLIVVMILLCMMDWKYGVAAGVILVLCFWYYHHMAIKQFGGITGDLAGWYLHIAELWLLIGMVMLGHVLEVIG